MCLKPFDQPNHIWPYAEAIGPGRECWLTMRGKMCFTYCGAQCDCGLAEEYSLDLIMRERVAPAAQEIIDENESVSETPDVSPHVASPEGRS